MSDQPLPERGVSPVAGRPGFFGHPRNRTIVMTAGGAATAALVTMGINSAIHDKGIEKAPDNTGATSISQFVSAPPPAVVASSPAQTPAAAPSQQTHVPITVVATQAPATVGVKLPVTSGEMFFAVPAGKPVEAADGAPGAVPATAAPGGTRGLQAPPTTTVAFKPSVLAGGKAGPAINMTYVMRPQLIPCALDTAMDSQFAGAIMCHTTQDILSQDHVLLLPAGTQVMGTYKNDVGGGQNRLFAFVGSAITKEGIPVELNSGVADGLGMTGVPGEVDHHYLEKFGAAILLSAADAAVSLGQSALSKAGSTNLNINSGETSSLATEVLRHSIDIPPTITVPPGTVISIVVDHPISFADALRVTTP